MSLKTTLNTAKDSLTSFFTGKPTHVRQLEDYYDHPVALAPKVALMEAARMTFSSTRFSTPTSIDSRHANAANWIIPLLDDPDIPAKRRLHLAVDMASVSDVGPVEGAVRTAALTTFEKLVHDPQIKHKFRLRAARALLRETCYEDSASPEKEAARRAIADLAPVSGKPVVTELTPYRICSTNGRPAYPTKAFNNLDLGYPIDLPPAPKSHIPGYP